MIFGDLNYWESEKNIYPAAVVKALEYIRGLDFSKLDNGRYEIEGQLIHINVFETTTAPLSQKRPETHAKFIDLHYLIEGSEVLGIDRYSDKYEVDEDCSQSRDVVFYKKAFNETALVLTPGCFAVCFPYDVHKPGCTIENVQKIRKALVKIDMSLIR